MGITNISTDRFCYGASVLLFIGIISSGIPGNLAVGYLSPQPEWIDLETYARNFHPIQMLPIWCGFIMLTGFLALMAGIHHGAAKEIRLSTLLAVVSTGVYVALISINYILQLGVLQPALTQGRLEGMTFLVFQNPFSVTMSMEMMGYAFQGLATWLVSPAFDQGPTGKMIRRLSPVNGLLSLAGALLQALNVPLTLDNPAGMISFVSWNVIFTVLCFLYVLYFLKKSRSRVGLSDF